MTLLMIYNQTNLSELIMKVYEVYNWRRFCGIPK